MKTPININTVSQYYHITEDGFLYSKIRQRWLKPQTNAYGYVFYFIKPYNKWIFAHTLVALRYIGLPPSPKHEINHIDENKMNNHHSNLEWCTHGENILRAYRNGREGYWNGKTKPPHTLETRMKMASAKNKRVMFKTPESEQIFKSIEDATKELNTYRKKIYLCIKNNSPFRNGKLSFIPDEAPITQ